MRHFLLNQGGKIARPTAIPYIYHDEVISSHPGPDVTGGQRMRGHGRAYRLDDDHDGPAGPQGLLGRLHGPAAIIADAHGDW